MATKECFPGIEKIKFEGKDSKNPMAFRYYDAEKVINGKKMKQLQYQYQFIQMKPMYIRELKISLKYQLDIFRKMINMTVMTLKD